MGKVGIVVIDCVLVRYGKFWNIDVMVLIYLCMVYIIDIMYYFLLF